MERPCVVEKSSVDHDADTLTSGAIHNFKAIADRAATLIDGGMQQGGWKVDASEAYRSEGPGYVNFERSDEARRFANRDWNDIMIMTPALGTRIHSLASVTGRWVIFWNWPNEASIVTRRRLSQTLVEFLKAQAQKPAA